MEKSYVLKSNTVYCGGKKVTLEYGKRYRATYYKYGKTLEFTYNGTPTYNKTIIWCDNVSGLQFGFCSECSSDWSKVEEI